MPLSAPPAVAPEAGWLPRRLALALQGHWAAALFAVVLGGGAFLLVVGPRVLDPQNIAWLGQGDPATHYLGWLFFRDAPWSFPLGLNPDYGLELGSAVLYSDSNPLLALLFKPFSGWLPEVFQYFGLWLLACFVLQAWFGWRLVGLFTPDGLTRGLGASLLVFAPPMLWRLNGHLSLCAHFLLLAALYLALSHVAQRRLLKWSLLLAVTAAVHAYLLAMVGFIWLVDLATRGWGQRDARGTLVELVVGLGCILLVAWQVGYFSIASGVVTEGFGLFRMDVLSLFNPVGWSYTLRDLPLQSMEIEGFNYLGLGVLVAALLSLPIAVARWPQLRVQAVRQGPLLLAALVLWLFALSHRVSLADHEFIVPLPDRLLALANIFRASGRFFWPVFYLLVLGVLFVLVTGYPRRVVRTVLGLCLVLQVVDTGAGYRPIRERMMVPRESAWAGAMLEGSFWTAVAAQYDRVRWLYPQNEPEPWRPLAYFAGRHGLATDAVYLARLPAHELQRAQARAKVVIETGAYDPDTLYVLGPRAFRQAVAAGVPAGTRLARVDGLNLVLPGASRLPDALIPRQDVSLASLAGPLDPGQPVAFDSLGQGESLLLGGWSLPEPWGVWSDGEVARLLLPVAPASAGSIRLQLSPHLKPGHPRQRVEASIDGRFAGRFELTGPEVVTLDIVVPQGLAAGASGRDFMVLELRLPDAVPPGSGPGEDARQLAVGLRTLVVHPSVP